MPPPIYTTPPKVPPRIKAAPKHKQLYWCDLPTDAQLPEFWKCRLVVVLSYKNGLFEPCTVVPITSVPQGNNRWAYKMQTSLEAVDSWAICNHILTVAPSRLSQHKGTIPKVTDEEFESIFSLVYQWLPNFALKPKPAEDT
jgi:mRNA interferase MazF